MPRLLARATLTLTMEGRDLPVLTRELSRVQLVALDVVVAAGYTLIVATMAATSGSALGAGQAHAPPTWLRWAIVLAMGLPLAVRRIWPVPAFAVAFGASAAALLLGIVRDDFAGAGYVLYLVAVSGPRARREPTLAIAGLSAAGGLLLVVAGAPVSPGADASAIVTGAVVLGAAWTIGRAVRERRLLARQASDQLVERAVADERLRIARDLHDVVAHGVSLMVVEAGTARHVMAARPERAGEALEVIEATGRAALAEMRRLLEVLRSSADVDGAELTPAPDLDHLPDLVDRVASAGVHVDLEVDATLDLPEGLAVSVYRIVQEALTNVVRHAAPARCRVTVRVAGACVRVEVVDDGLRAGLAGDASGVGSYPSRAGPGHGLIGMRERVRALGGRFEAGPLPGRGFRVVAEIPWSGGSSLGGATGGR
jgi:signal transduction histidine kinase